MIGYNAALVLEAVRQGSAWGFEMMRVTGLPSGTIYPLLRRLEAGGLVRSQWERASEAQAEGRPRRREYRITAAGRTALAGALPRLRAQTRLLGGAMGGESQALEGQG
ncbi:MAG: PadR family transcriptional regulator [Gemmatimonadetes bacterium]|nr:PadR family transcriptional regulator [Gemmatimonadota bacterium]